MFSKNVGNFLIYTTVALYSATLCLAQPTFQAFDDAYDYVYSDNWEDGDNGGRGFGPWDVYVFSGEAIVQDPFDIAFNNAPLVNRNYEAFTMSATGFVTLVPYVIFAEGYVTGSRQILPVGGRKDGEKIYFRYSMSRSNPSYLNKFTVSLSDADGSTSMFTYTDEVGGRGIYQCIMTIDATNEVVHFEKISLASGFSSSSTKRYKGGSGFPEYIRFSLDQEYPNFEGSVSSFVNFNHLMVDVNGTPVFVPSLSEPSVVDLGGYTATFDFENITTNGLVWVERHTGLGSPPPGIRAALIPQRLLIKSEEGFVFGEEGFTFDSATVTIEYDEGDLNGIAEEDIVSAYKVNGSSFEEVEATVDTSNNTITFTTDGFSEWFFGKSNSPVDEWLLY